MKELLYMLQIIISLFVIVLFLDCGGRNTKQDDRYSQQRKAMVKSQIINRSVTDQRLLKAMEKVPRHLFVPIEYQNEAYADYPLSIGQGQTISQPYIVARMTELAQLNGNEKVLEIGTGSGYQAAVLSLLVKEVYTIELLDSLARTAEQRLKKLNYQNVHVRSGDGYLGWTEAQPFDVILITCAPPSLPESLVSQLKDGGRIVVPMGGEYETQILTVFEKKEDKLIKTQYDPVRFVPMKGLIEERK